MSSAYPVSIRQLRGRMAPSIFFLFLPISLIPALALGLILLLLRAYLLARQIPSAQPASLGRLPAVYLLVGILLFVLALAATGLLTWRLAQRHTRPLDELAEAMSLFVQGNRELRALIDKPNEVGTLARLFNQMANELSTPGRSAASGSTEHDAGMRQAISQLSQMATLGIGLDDFLDRTLDLIVTQLGCSFAGFYLLEQAGPLGPNLAVLRHSIASPEFKATSLAHRLEEKATDVDASATQDWPVRRAIDSTRTQVGPPAEEPGMLEAAFPLMKGEQVLGVLDLFTGERTAESSSVAFSARILSDLHDIANIATLVIANAAQSQGSQTDQAIVEAQEFSIQDANLIYQASHPIVQAETIQQVFDDAAKVLYGSPYHSAILVKDEIPGPGRMRLIYRGFSMGSTKRSRIPSLDGSEQTPTGIVGAEVSIESITPYLVNPERLSPRPVIAANISVSPLPDELLEVPRQMGCDAAAFIPVLRAGQVVALLMLGKSGQEKILPTFTMQTLEPYINLIELMVMTLDKIRTQQGTQRRLAELQTIRNISEKISGTTNLDALFREIHKQVEAVMGEVDSFAIALYEAGSETVQIPYKVEGGRQGSTPPFPVGEDLISIVVFKRKPLLLAENLEENARLLGVWKTGVTARSWLGVPLLFGGEAIGAIIVQDNEREHRFGEDDEHLLSTLAAQVAVVVRNAWLQETTRHRADQERLLNEITAKIRRSVDIQAILKTTADELGAALGAQRARIEITRPRLLESSSPEKSTYRSRVKPKETAG
jgi:GAF domain-containing protein/HAMP domain-containing protein